MNSLLRKLIAKAMELKRAWSIALFGHPILSNVNGSAEQHDSRRALLVYLVEPFLLRKSNPRFLDHQNLKQCLQIAAVLGRAGYIVDVADVGDEKIVSGRLRRDYDIILCHRVDFGVAGSTLLQDTTKVYLATGMHHRVHNRNLLARYERLHKRRACQLNSPTLNPEYMPFVEKADAVVGFGNEFTAGTWKSAIQGPVFPFNNYGFENTKFDDEKDFASARNNFLFFGSRNQVRKGLDLLLEVFPRHAHLHLHICSMFEQERDFCECYDVELYHTPNIHPLGIVRVNSKQFYDLVAQCAFVILPSCEEGQPGSVVQTMHAGVIPLLTQECGIDMANVGWMFSNDSEQEIERFILDVSTLSPETLRAAAQHTRHVAITQYSEAAFIQRWETIVAELQNLSTREQTT